MIPLLKDNLTPVINMLIPAMVDNNLNSKNPGIYAAATNVIQALCQHLGKSKFKELLFPIVSIQSLHCVMHHWFYSHTF